MPLSPQVQKDDEHGQQPGHAILAFVSLAEKPRFLHQLSGFRIRDLKAITTGHKRLKYRKLNSSKDGRRSRRSPDSPRRENRSSHRRPPFEGSHVTGSVERPVAPGSRSYDAPEMLHDTTTANGKPDLPDPFSMKNGVADPGAVSDDPRGNLCGTTSPSIPTARAPTWCNLPLNGSPPLSNGITADSIMRPRGGPGIFGLG